MRTRNFMLKFFSLGMVLMMFLSLSDTVFYANSSEELLSDSDTVEVEDDRFLNQLEYLNKEWGGNKGCQRIEGRYAVVGDIHGYLDVFKNVVKKLSEDIDDNHIDGVVFLGDFWDRGKGDRDVFKELINFMCKYNAEGKQRIIVLRGNHETIGYDGKMCAYIKALKNSQNLCDQRIGTEVERFYRNLPFNVIINKNTYAVHGGLPIRKAGEYPELRGDIKKLFSSAVDGDADSYPTESLERSAFNLLYSSVWSDFDENAISIEETPRDEQCRLATGELSACVFGKSDVVRFLRFANEVLKGEGLKIRNIIAGHDHSMGRKFPGVGCDTGGVKCSPCLDLKLPDSENYFFTKVITACPLTKAWGDSSGAVALVSPDLEKPIKCYEVEQDNRVTNSDEYAEYIWDKSRSADVGAIGLIEEDDELLFELAKVNRGGGKGCTINYDGSSGDKVDAARVESLKSGSESSVDDKTGLESGRVEPEPLELVDDKGYEERESGRVEPEPLELVDDKDCVEWESGRVEPEPLELIDDLSVDLDFVNEVLERFAKCQKIGSDYIVVRDSGSSFESVVKELRKALDGGQKKGVVFLGGLISKCLSGRVDESKNIFEELIKLMCDYNKGGKLRVILTQSVYDVSFGNCEFITKLKKDDPEIGQQIDRFRALLPVKVEIDGCSYLGSV